MTPSPHTIGSQQTLSVAHKLMRDFGLRHLPVLDGGKLVGIVSQRDLYFLETLRDVIPETTAVSEAMTEDAYAVPPGTPLDEVADAMARGKYGCAVVTEHGKLLGIFSAVDGLRVLAQLERER